MQAAVVMEKASVLALDDLAETGALAASSADVENAAPGRVDVRLAVIAVAACGAVLREQLLQCLVEDVPFGLHLREFLLQPRFMLSGMGRKTLPFLGIGLGAFGAVCTVIRILRQSWRSSSGERHVPRMLQ